MSISWGDGATSFDVENENGVAQTHLYEALGRYSIVVEACVPSGACATAMAEVRVEIPSDAAQAFLFDGDGAFERRSRCYREF